MENEKNETVVSQPSETRRQMSPSTAIIIAGAMISLAVLAGGYFRSTGTLSGSPKVALVSAPEYKVKATDIPNLKNWRIGPADAPVVITEFTDTECPFCKKSHTIIHEVLDHYAGKVALVYKHFPLESLHSYARNEAKALECAGSIGGNVAFWNFADTVFVNTQSNDGLDPSLLPAIAKKIGLNEKKFSECLANNKFDEKIDADLKEGESLGVQGTPFFVIEKDGKQIATIPGAYPADTFYKKIDPLLQAQ